MVLCVDRLGESAADSGVFSMVSDELVSAGEGMEGECCCCDTGRLPVVVALFLRPKNERKVLLGEGDSAEDGAAEEARTDFRLLRTARIR
jgi:hypothetical protein